MRLKKHEPHPQEATARTWRSGKVMSLGKGGADQTPPAAPVIAENLDRQILAMGPLGSRHEPQRATAKARTSVTTP